jgi:hypothetical protein
MQYMSYRSVFRGVVATAFLVAINCPDKAQAQSSASLTVSGFTDSQSGTSFDADAYFAPNHYWSIGGGVGQSDSNLPGSEFSGKSLRLSTDVTLGNFNASVFAQQWKDASKLDSVSTQGQFTWTIGGFGVAAIIDDRTLKVHYEVRAPLNQTRPARVDFDGTGYGADLSYFGEQWNVSIRSIHYGYGPSLARVRAAFNAPTTQDFPRVQALIDSIVTRAAGAPERELSIGFGRSLKRSSLQGQWMLQRDALTQTDINSVSLRHGYKFTPHIELGTTLGFSKSSSIDSVAFGGLALTLRR